MTIDSVTNITPLIKDSEQLPHVTLAFDKNAPYAFVDSPEQEHLRKAKDLFPTVAYCRFPNGANKSLEFTYTTQGIEVRPQEGKLLDVHWKSGSWERVGLAGNPSSYICLRSKGIEYHVHSLAKE